MREAGLGLKAATITPEGADDVGSPNRILREAVDGQVIVKTYRTVLDDYRTHPESKSLGPDGTPCDRQTVGLLTRRPVKLAAVHYIGKESNKIEEALSGLVADQDDELTEYREPGSDPLWQLAVRVLRELPVAQTAAGAGVSERTVQRARAGQTLRKAARTKLTDHAVKHARAPAPRRRHPAPDRPRGAARHIPRTAEHAQPGTPALRVRMRPARACRHPRGGPGSTSTTRTASEHSAGKSDSRVSLSDNSEVTC
jgi:hypothetical protein